MPGPACVPTTAPSVVTSSTSACGRIARTSAELGGPLGGLRVGDPDPKSRSVGRRRVEAAGELPHRLLPAARAGERDDLAVDHGEDRLQVQDLPGEGAGAADPPAAGEELERVDGEEQAGLLGVVRGQRLDLLVGRAARAAAAGSRAQASRSPPRQCASRAGAPGRRRAPAPRAGAREGPGEVRGDVQREDPLVAGQLLVDAEEVLRRRLRGGRQLGRRAKPVVERVRAEFDVVAEALVAEADVERHDAHVGEALGRFGEVGRRVEHDRGVRRRQVHAVVSATAAARIAPTITSRAWSLRQAGDRAGGEQRRLALIGSADAVRQTTRAPGHSASTAVVASTPSRPGIR